MNTAQDKLGAFKELRGAVQCLENNGRHCREIIEKLLEKSLFSIVGDSITDQATSHSWGISIGSGSYVENLTFEIPHAHIRDHTIR